jgi:hypothetical protein
MTYDAEPVIESNRESYGWAEARADLEEGVNPITVADRMGEPVDFIREVAEQQGWPITFKEAA